MNNNNEERFYKAVTCLLLGIDYLPNLKNLRHVPIKNHKRHTYRERVNFMGDRVISLYHKDLEPKRPHKMSLKYSNVNMTFMNNLRKNQQK
ncbi:uncharacterized protein VNE69_06237 [Vairimorpha necatrix]|uniref:LAGLIDADG homing endonuclease n=1 Tax=Vairimorpha necatrix TaxID=6039 RepID=A0AAX4JD84_9MICR